MRAPHFLIVALLFLLMAGTASADIYRWTDADGQVHFTQDLGQVPAEHRKEAELSQHRVRTHEVQTFENVSPPARGRGVAHRTSLPAPGRKLQMPFELRGSAMWVYVQINDRTTAPFIVDTGASDVAVPGHVAAAAGIRIDADTPRATYQTANGLVRQPIVRLDSVQVGGVRVEGVRGSINESMQVGLLGGSFFNNFTFQVDPAAQMITLVPNPGVRSGIPERDWRKRFAETHSRIDELDRYLANNVFSRESRRRQFAQKREALQDRLAALEEEADLAGVPQAWRN
jgi:clan AA aspartic protease (TIGR02281 family)